jgi:hypothetical protein
MTRLLTLVALSLAMAFTPVLGEARSKRIHVTAEVVETTLIGDPAEPKIGDQRITSVKRLDKHDKHETEVGTGTGICTLVTAPDPEALVQCFITATFDKKGQIIFGGVAPLPNIGAVGHFGIFGGTGDFRKARGEVTLVVISDKLQDATFDIDIDSERRHDEFTAQ